MVASLIVSSFTGSVLPVPTVTVDGDSAVIWLSGEQDLAVVAALRTAIRTARATPLADGPRSIVVDLSNVTFIDTSTARALIEMTTSATAATPVATLRDPSNCVRRMLSLCGHPELLEGI